VTPEQFMNSFGVVAEAEGGVRKLRSLVFSLAILGRLSERWVGDGDARDVLRMVDERRGTLTDNKKNRSLATQVKNSPSQHELPAHWRWCALSQVAIFRDGERIPVSKIDRERRHGVYDYYGASGVIDSIDGYLFDGPLLLVGEDGANLLLRSKPVAFIARGRYWVNNHAHVLDSANEDVLRYLELFINATDLAPYVSGTAQPKMNQAKMKTIPVALPPLAEQKRIVAKVDQLMTMLDDLEQRQAKKRTAAIHVSKASLDSLVNAEDPDQLARAWERVSKNFGVVVGAEAGGERLRDVVLSMCMSGLFVRGDTVSSSADVVGRARLAVEALEASTRTRSRSVVTEQFGNADALGAVSNAWCWTRLGLITSISGGVTKGRVFSGKKTVSLPYLRVANIQRWTINLDLVKEIDVLAGEVEKYRLRFGDVLLTEGGDWDKLGRAAVWRGEMDLCLHQNHVFRVRAVTDEILPEWIEAWCNCRIGREYFQRASKQTTNLASINMTQLRSLPIPIPPTDEQRRILTRIQMLAVLLDQLEAKSAKKGQVGERLAHVAVTVE
jgi:type I restriction enzyme, S subunit